MTAVSPGVGGGVLEDASPSLDGLRRPAAVVAAVRPWFRAFGQISPCVFINYIHKKVAITAADEPNNDRNMQIKHLNKHIALGLRYSVDSIDWSNAFWPDPFEGAGQRFEAVSNEEADFIFLSWEGGGAGNGRLKAHPE